MPDTQPVDLVLGGGGVRGIAHVGALHALHDAGYTVNRVAGASSGAIAGALLAAGSSPEDMQKAMTELDWQAFTFSDILGRLSDTPFVGGMLDRLTGDRTLDPLVWIEGLLDARGVHTWADLRMEDAEDWIPPRERYKLVVRCLDVVHSRTVRLPWDYHRYGLEADDQSVATAIRASMAVPLVFDPVPLGDRDDGGGLLIDGGLGAGFDVATLDRRDGRPPSHPTFALQLADREVNSDWPANDLALLRAVVETMIVTGNDMSPVGGCDEARTIRLDTAQIRTLDVRITPEEEESLMKMGRQTMAGFLEGYDHEDYVARCRSGS